MGKERNKTVIAVIVAIILCVLIVAPIAWYAGSKSVKVNEPEKKEEKDCKPEEEEKKEEIVTIDKVPMEKKPAFKYIAYDEVDADGSLIVKVEITQTGDALLTQKKYVSEPIENVLIGEHVMFTKVVHVGMSDTCAGNARLLLFHEDKTISSFNIDALVCGENIRVKKNVGGLTGVTSIREEIKLSNLSEPEYYTVYATDGDGIEHNIEQALLED